MATVSGISTLSMSVCLLLLGTSAHARDPGNRGMTDQEVAEGTTRCKSLNKGFQLYLVVPTVKGSQDAPSDIVTICRKAVTRGSDWDRIQHGKDGVPQVKYAVLVSSTENPTLIHSLYENDDADTWTLRLLALKKCESPETCGYRLSNFLSLRLTPLPSEDKNVDLRAAELSYVDRRGKVIEASRDYDASESRFSEFYAEKRFEWIPQPRSIPSASQNTLAEEPALYLGTYEGRCGPYEGAFFGKKYEKPDGSFDYKFGVIPYINNGNFYSPIIRAWLFYDQLPKKVEASAPATHLENGNWQAQTSDAQAVLSEEDDELVVKKTYSDGDVLTCRFPKKHQEQN